MDDNPYRSPAPVTPEPVAPGSVGPDGRVRTARDIRAIARGQRGVIACIAANIVGVVVFLAAKEYAEPFMPFVFLAIGAANLIFAVPLGYRVGSVILGIGAGIAGLIPCVGLLALVVLNQRATKILQAAGLRVGFFGVSPSEVRRRFPTGPEVPGP